MGQEGWKDFQFEVGAQEFLALFFFFGSTHGGSWFSQTSIHKMTKYHDYSILATGHEHEIMYVAEQESWIPRQQWVKLKSDLICTQTVALVSVESRGRVLQTESLRPARNLQRFMKIQLLQYPGHEGQGKLPAMKGRVCSYGNGQHIKKSYQIHTSTIINAMKGFPRKRAREGISGYSMAQLSAVFPFFR